MLITLLITIVHLLYADYRSKPSRWNHPFRRRESSLPVSISLQRKQSTDGASRTRCWSACYRRTISTTLSIASRHEACFMSCQIVSSTLQGGNHRMRHRLLLSAIYADLRLAMSYCAVSSPSGLHAGGREPIPRSRTQRRTKQVRLWDLQRVFLGPCN
jgi:hypothetical protein